MLKHLSHMRVLLALLVSTLAVCGSAFIPSPAFAAKLPSRADFSSAISTLENLGEYQAYFGPNSSKTLDNNTPHYQEYLYLYQLVSDANLLLSHYGDNTFLAQHHLPESTFTDVYEEMYHAKRGCNLIFNADQFTNISTSKTETPTTSDATSDITTPSTNSASVPATSTATTKTSQTAETSNSTSKVVANASDQNRTTIATQHTNTEAAQPTTSITDTEDSQNTEQAEVSDHTTADVEVPTTGIIEASPENTRRVSWSALIAVVITGAAVASICIAVIIRHESHPRRATTSRARSQSFRKR